jgi:hypothetical protein
MTLHRVLEPDFDPSPPPSLLPVGLLALALPGFVTLAPVR